MTDTEQQGSTAPINEEAKQKQLKKDRILLVIYVIAVLSVAYYLDSKITSVKGQQYYDKGTTNPTKP